MQDLSALMDLMPIDDIAKRLGVDETTARSAVERSLPTIVAGLAENAKDERGARSLERALQKHRPAGGLRKRSVGEIDTDDGDRIVTNVFGQHRSGVVKAVAAKTQQADESLIQKLLPILAPIVLSWLASRFLGQKGGAGGSGSGGGPGSGGGLGDLLGGLLGGGSGGILGGALDGLLGGGKR